jgi:hypothetical protein
MGDPMGKPSQGVLDANASIRTDGRLTELQVAVERYLRAEYDLEDASFQDHRRAS